MKKHAAAQLRELELIQTYVPEFRSYDTTPSQAGAKRACTRTIIQTLKLLMPKGNNLGFRLSGGIPTLGNFDPC